MDTDVKARGSSPVRQGTSTVSRIFATISSDVFSFASACGFALALVLMAGLRERFALVAIPKPFEGTAIGLVTAGLIALAFSGFAGLV